MRLAHWKAFASTDVDTGTNRYSYYPQSRVLEVADSEG